VKPCDAAALAAALERLVGDPAAAARMGAAGRARSEADCSWETAAARAEAALERLLGDGFPE